MYVAEVPNRDSPPAFLLRESFRENGKVKNRTLANLSSWPRPRIDALRRLLRGELDDVAVSDPTMGPTLGVLSSLKKIAAETGVVFALGADPPGEGGVVLCPGRLARPGSPLSPWRCARFAGTRPIRRPSPRRSRS